ncbi:MULTISPECIES: ABC transporter permease [unclassified Rhizobium]|jgi:peptide/nickel transport system permease protein|uniref:ABC transporter permease n=1 Tax=Rhizobium/Agrobacterium group TaxID=227290 RepID=UPI000713E7CD|nr:MULTISPECIES: ABC transporter permease [unclassified Rhizobium]KQQ72321.1 diguanylate cyclase [Rhizobium sp. Leaf321]MBD8650253.1 ABC transporter permease [Rhizobium sp. CFBP 13726]MBP2460963.1 peptide/nickel transport system permease protein [Rhizobium sp. PvP014]MBP2528359.1 peptide/nickel transport system permease protein [Rhizobium sp. PvP099]
MTAIEQTAPIAKPRQKSRAWRKMRANRGSMVGMVIIAFFAIIAIAAPILPIADPIATSWSALRKAPSAAHWLGTDDLGRDILSRMIWGARASLMAGVVSVAIAVAIGVPFGLLSGYFGGWVDQVIQRVTEALLAMPFLITAIALAAFLGPSLTNAMIAIGLSAMPVFVRLTRGQVLAVKTEDYVEGARSIGLNHVDIMTRYILPNVFAPIIVQATLTVATAIIAEASLSFLGLGQQAPAPSWGSMLNTAKNFLSQAPWMAMWPGIAIFLVVIGFNLLGDGLRDALDPREA